MRTMSLPILILASRSAWPSYDHTPASGRKPCSREREREAGDAMDGKGGAGKGRVEP